MNEPSADPPAATRPRWLQRWHRAVGLGSALFLFALAGSGLLLMFSDALHLPSRQVDQSWLMNWYGIHAPPSPRGFQHGPHWVTQLGVRLYFDTREISRVDGVLLGVFDVGDESPDEWLAITDTELLVVDDAGTVLEHLGRGSGLPVGVTSVGRDAQDHIVLASSAGRYLYKLDSGEFVLDTDNAAVQWSAGTTPPAAVTDVVAKAYRGEGLSLERVVLDIHSGRLFGRWGRVIIICASVALLFLAASGVFAAVRRARTDSQSCRDGE